MELIVGYSDSFAGENLDPKEVRGVLELVVLMGLGMEAIFAQDPENLSDVSHMFLIRF